MAGHGLKTESDVGRRVVEVSQVFNIKTPVSDRVIEAGALKVCRNEIAGSGRFFIHPFDTFERLAMSEVRRSRRVGTGDLA